MAAIAPLSRQDIPQVARLWTHFQSGSDDVPAGTEAYFERIYCESPWFDPELPSLVMRDDEGMVLAFIGSSVRRMKFKGESIRAVCSGPMLLHPEASNPALSGLLLGRLLKGPQELTFTDGAHEGVTRLWERFGGAVAQPHRLRWSRFFRPLGFAAGYALRAAPRVGRVASALGRVIDAGAVHLPRTPLRAKPSPLVGETLTPQLLLEYLPRMSKGLQLYPAYAQPFLTWIFYELRQVRNRGALQAVLVRDPAGEPVGWYLYFLKPGGLSRVLQVVSIPGRWGDVLDHLFWHAFRGRAAVLHGRLEPKLVDPLAQRACFFQAIGSKMLIHARHPDILNAVMAGRALLSRLEGETWMGYVDDAFHV